MSEDRLYQKAISLIKAKNYEGAKLILEELDSEAAKALLNRVNSAISRQKQAALGNRSQTPEKPQNAPLPDYAKLSKGIAPEQKQGIDFTGMLVALAIFIAAAGLGLFVASILDNPYSADWASSVYGWGIFILTFVAGVALQRRFRP